MSISNDTAMRLVAGLMLEVLKQTSTAPPTQTASNVLAPQASTPLTSFQPASLLGTTPVNSLQAAGKTGSTANIDKNTVLLFDSKNPDGFDHIGEMTKEITANAGAGITVKPVDIGFGADKLSQLETGLNGLIADAQAGRPVPGVINLSMIATGNDAQIQRLQQKIKTLADSGVKFAIALPPSGVNTFIPPGGNPNVIGVSNVAGTPGATTGNGRTPSFATANTAGNLIKQLSKEPVAIASNIGNASPLSSTVTTGAPSTLQANDPLSLFKNILTALLASLAGT
jgi:hypothetical protein